MNNEWHSAREYKIQDYYDPCGITRGHDVIIFLVLEFVFLRSKNKTFI
jgi:hypothetical protein